LPSESGFLFAGGADDVIHPGTEVQVGVLVASVDLERLRDYADDAIFRFDYEAYAEGCPAERGALRIPTEEVQRLLEP
jgi:hypothetical protein